MQARIQWTAPSGVLGRLTERARLRAEKIVDTKAGRAELNAAPALSAALKSATVSVIAEVKRRSPSKGALNESIDAGQRARLYADGGAVALSILTEPSEFGGSLDDLTVARAATSVPLLRKDFHVHPVQLFEARAYGASAALLIMRALGPDDTRIMADAAREAGIEAVFEVRDDAELSWALDAGANMIGVNRRNLETLEMEDGVVEALIPVIPRNVFAIAESGVSSRSDVERAAVLGADAVLVGSSLSLAADPQDAVAQLAGVARSAGVRG
ncbi:MAG TPA: indole-3-glycerol-phosphate synthase [Gemmatimonadaceae bacterium]|nr:indole-3-glycerol-phosphate synthase [Gemmatimonadaceae bacterium]